MIVQMEDNRPQLGPDVFIAPSAVVIGRVRLGASSSVWYGSVLRGDDEDIVLGVNCNVQDGSIIHADPGFPAVLGDRVTIGHGAIVHGAVIEDDVLIGMRAVILNGARIGSGSVVAAGSVVTRGTVVPPGSLVVGVPGKVVRDVGKQELDMIARAARSYVQKAARHRAALALLEGEAADHASEV